MDKFIVHVKWEMFGKLEIEARNAEEAKKRVYLYGRPGTEHYLRNSLHAIQCQEIKKA